MSEFVHEVLNRPPVNKDDVHTLFGYIFCTLNGIVLNGDSTEDVMAVVTDSSGLTATDHYINRTREEVKIYLLENIYKLTGIDLPTFLRMDMISVRIIMEGILKYRNETSNNIEEILDD